MAESMGSGILLQLDLLTNKWVIIGAAGVLAILVLVLIIVLVSGGKDEEGDDEKGRKKDKGKKRKSSVIKLGGQGPVEEWSAEIYEPVLERLKRKGKKCKSVLFASAGVEGLPSAVCVSVAGILAKGGKKCLIVDLDLVGDGVAKTFGIDSQEQGVEPRAVRTRFKDLWVWPAHYFSRLKHMNVGEIVDKAEEKFDVTILNAPGMLGSPDRRHIISSADGAFLCGKVAAAGVEADFSELAELVRESDCRLIGCVEIS